MVENWLLKILLFPFSLLFGMGVALKNLLYRTRMLNSVKFSVPVIGIGNLSIGGTGKTPHVEYLIRLLRPYLRTAVVSRGYGRKTSGFILVAPQHMSSDVGDEPLIYARKYRDVAVAVSESRSVGIPMLMQQRPGVQVMLLDDAFQHRSVTPYLNILLTEYGHPYFRDWLLPSGRLREWPVGAYRADLVIVTKCPLDLSEQARDTFLSKMRPAANQAVYFSGYRYHQPYAMYPPSPAIGLRDLESALIICGIARPDALFDYIASEVENVDMSSFEDHHVYQSEDLQLLETRFRNLPGERKVILTTEKDAVRLEPFGAFIKSHQLPVYILPIEVVFLFDRGPDFDRQIRQFLLAFRV